MIRPLLPIPVNPLEARRSVRTVSIVRFVREWWTEHHVEHFPLIVEAFRREVEADAVVSEDACGCGHERWMHEHDRPAEGAVRGTP